MKTLKLHQLATLAFALLFGAAVSAAPTPTSPYVTDPQHEYVQDATSEAINTVNMVLCIMNGMNIVDSGMLNVGPYIALIDMNKCDAKGGSSSSSSGSSGASTAVNYMTAVVNATRANDTSPMIGNVWMSMTEEGRKQDIYVRLTATTAPSATLPYGVFRLDFLGKDASNVTQFNGYIDSSTGSLQYYETGPNSSNVSLNMAASTTDAGSGIMTLGVSNWNPTALTYNFNYNTDFFRRSDGTNDQCFDRLKANAKRSVWRYGTYNSNDGSRVDQANPSFQLNGTYAGSSYYGYASYWGMGFQGLDLNTIADANPISGLVVTDQRPGHTDTFSLSKVGGKLTKWTRNATTLAAMDGIPFYFSGDLNGAMTDNPTEVNGWFNWQMQWNNTAQNFTVTGKQVCGSNNCTLTALNTIATVAAATFNNKPISGWSDSFGGSINIPYTTAPHVSGDTVTYFTQSTVIPGSAGAPTALYCLNSCLDATSVGLANGYVAPAAAPNPFSTVTANQWGSATLGNTINYTYGAAGLLHGTTSMIIANAAFFSASPNYQYGLSTGRLFDTDFAPCSGAGASPVCEPSDPATFYSWSTGTGQWNQSMWLTRTNGANSGAVVAFDPPQNIMYTVPAGAAYGTWANKAIQLQFNGFGNLYGIPGYCVSPISNAEVPCGPNTRYVPAFSMPDGATMSLGTTPLIIKALDAEVRLNDLGAGAAQCSAMSLATTLTAPTGGTHDPSSSADAYYIGVKPAVTTAPKVIDGVVQY
ncbi:MAG: hypothetical protein HZB47_06505 [Nitrosomonadales bacterium]|nr:hypothetical protein [Nitrosomonadales bacterium]